MTTGYLSVEWTTYTCYTYISLNNTWVLTGQTTSYSWNYYADAWGVRHPLNASSTVNWGSCNGTNYPPSQNANVTATDGSGYTLTTAALGMTGSTAKIITREGTVTNPPRNSNGGSASYTDYFGYDWQGAFMALVFRTRLGAASAESHDLVKSADKNSELTPAGVPPRGRSV